MSGNTAGHFYLIEIYDSIEIQRSIGKKNPHQINDEDSLINKAATYSPRKTQVPSAMGDLTSLFGMGRGEHPRQNHLKTVILSDA